MEQIIVSLSEAKSQQDLARSITEEQLEGNFDSLFLYMIDKNGDGNNPPYDSDKLITLNSLQESYNLNKNEGIMKLTYVSTIDGQNRKVQLTDIVKDQEGILHDGDELFGDINDSYKQIELICTYAPNGGN